MRRIFSFMTLVILLCGWGLTTAVIPTSQRDKKEIEEQQDKPKGQAALRVAVDLVRVNVTVQDKKSNLILGLNRGNFRIYEDKVLQKIDHLEASEASMTVVMVTEYSRVLPREWLYEAWLASHWFVKQMRREDWLAIVTYDMKPQILVDFTQNNMEAFNALRALNFPGFRESNLYDAIFDVLQRLEEVAGKTAIVLISSGIDTFSRKNFGEILDAVKETNVVIYAVSLGGYFRTRYDQQASMNTRMDLLQADSALKAFTKYTGGQAFFPRFLSQYAGHFQAISKLLRHQYSLGYISTNTAKDGKFRKIKVKVTVDIDGDGKPDKLKVRHREGYLVEKSPG